MLQARVALHRALEIFERQTRSEAMRDIIRQLRRDVQAGASFDQALARHPTVFDQLTVVSAEAGQESGRLPEVFLDLARHTEKMYALKRKLTQAMAYPALVLCVALCAVTFLLLFIVPSFAEMFSSFQIELPTSTRLVMGLSDLIARFGPFVLIALAPVVLRGKKLLNLPLLRRLIDRYRFSLPLVGDIALKTAVARFCRTLGTLLQAEVSMVDALALTEKISTSQRLKEEIRAMLTCIRQGLGVADPLADSHLFPPMVVQMIAVGEETSELDAMLLKVAEYYERDLDGKIDMLSSVIEPVLILLLGIVVAAILISMYLPMFDVVNVVGGL
jgi:type IV pilus assembly protein PilC